MAPTGSRAVRMKPPTCPVRIKPVKQGFTFLEVLIAMAVAVLLATITCSSLITVLRSEESARRLRDGSLLVESITSAAYRQAPDENYLKTTFTDWDIQSELQEEAVKPNRIVWRIWKLHPKERPSLCIELAYRNEH